MSTPPPTAPGPYGPPGSAQGQRPGLVTAAAVLAFVSGGLGIIGGLISFGALSIVGAAYVVVILIQLAISAVLIWGGVQAMGGKDGRILVALAGLSIIISIITVIIRGAPTGIIGIIVPVLILVFMLNQKSKAWIQSQGGQTF